MLTKSTTSSGRFVGYVVEHPTVGLPRIMQVERIRQFVGRDRQQLIQILYERDCELDPEHPTLPRLWIFQEVGYLAQRHDAILLIADHRILDLNPHRTKMVRACCPISNVAAGTIPVKTMRGWQGQEARHG